MPFQFMCARLIMMSLKYQLYYRCSFLRFFILIDYLIYWRLYFLLLFMIMHSSIIICIIAGYKIWIEIRFLYMFRTFDCFSLQINTITFNLIWRESVYAIYFLIFDLIHWEFNFNLSIVGWCWQFLYWINVGIRSYTNFYIVLNWFRSNKGIH